MRIEDVQTMADAYIECALFTADEELVAPKSGEFDQTPYLHRVTKKMRVEALHVCTEFYNANSADLTDYPADSAGHDLWYTRNHHGVGFWEADHCDKEQGERLTSAAHKLGDCSIWSPKGRWFDFINE